MRRILLVAPAMILLLFSTAVESQAMSAYARNFDMKCGECHKQRIPELNDFGIAFYKNGFVLPGIDQGKAPTPSSEEKTGTTSDPPDPPDAPVNKAPDTGGAPDEKEGTPTPVPPPEIPLVIYKGQAGDGSVYFTDNPLSKGAEREIGKRKAAKVSVVRQPPQKPALPPKKPAAPEYHTYQECMERHLENAPAASTQQMMDLLITAEAACARYSRGKP